MPKTIANPRLIDHFSLSFVQADVDFAIPHLLEDIPLYVDPFLLWSSESTEYNELHQRLLGFFETIRRLVVAGRRSQAFRLLIQIREPKEMGLGYALASKRGSAIGPKLANSILDAYEVIPQLFDANVNHVEELQLVVPGVAEDRIGDVAGCILKDFFVEYTEQTAKKLSIPTKRFMVDGIWDQNRELWRPGGNVHLPFNPLDETPLLFAPLNLLRHLPWINYEDYYRSGYAQYVLGPSLLRGKVPKPAVLAFNRSNYTAVERYVREKELLAPRCKPDPLFEPLSLPTLKKKFAVLRDLPTGKIEKSDRRYEEIVSDVLSSLLYPELIFAESRVRTASGVHIRDLIFYNDSRLPFLRDVSERYDARQPVFELKNVLTLETEHVNQLFRYLDEEFGRFGVLVTRNPPSKAVLKNTVDLHSSKRCIVLCIDDSDIELMLNLWESDRNPVEAIKKKFVEFTRLLPK